MRKHCANCVYTSCTISGDVYCHYYLCFECNCDRAILSKSTLMEGGGIYDTTINYHIITLHFITSHYYVRSAEIISNLDHSTATTKFVFIFCVFSFSVVSFCSWNKRKGILTTKSIPKYREKNHKWVNYSCSLAKSSNKSTPC
jgi:hypothetical protein